MHIKTLFMISALLLVGISFHANARGMKHKHHGSLPTPLSKSGEEKGLEKHKVADSCSRNPQSCSGGKKAGLAESVDPRSSQIEPELIQVPQG
ncbi:MAG: hypothetical protein K2P93_07705 [Alphaproteobacteria bacterium]|nr:hypothetical protein [Alphaproteobacteria bacterium]